jgi:hypothetical protein
VRHTASARIDEMVTVRCGQGQKAVTDAPFNRSSSRIGAELKLAELTSRLEAGVNEGTVDCHDLERADHLVPGAEPASPAAGDGGQGEQIILRSSAGASEEITAQGDHVAVAQKETLRAIGPAKVHVGASGGGLADLSVLLRFHLALADHS